jgi:thiaminase/transcriptional activator TenA
VKFTDGLLKAARPCIEHLRTHPMITGLATGRLPTDIWHFYLEQDAHYLQAFPRAITYIARKCQDPAHQKILSGCTAGVIAAEQDYIAAQHLAMPATAATLTPACREYVAFLQQIATHESVGCGIAAVTPCFWVYNTLGHEVFVSTAPTNPYYFWLAAYKDSKFTKTTGDMLTLLDHYARHGDATERARMTELFYLSCHYERRFWHDAYHRAPPSKGKMSYTQMLYEEGARSIGR